MVTERRSPLRQPLKYRLILSFTPGWKVVPGLVRDWLQWWEKSFAHFLLCWRIGRAGIDWTIDFDIDITVELSLSSSSDCKEGWRKESSLKAKKIQNRSPGGYRSFLGVTRRTLMNWAVWNNNSFIFISVEMSEGIRYHCSHSSGSFSHCTMNRQ